MKMKAIYVNEVLRPLEKIDLKEKKIEIKSAESVILLLADLVVMRCE